jgi:hypothetical protein
VLAPGVLAIPWLLLTPGFGLPDRLSSLAGLVLILLLVTVTLIDLTRRRIPNWATYPAAAWALALPLLGALVPADAAVSIPSIAGVIHGTRPSPVPVRGLLAVKSPGKA